MFRKKQKVAPLVAVLGCFFFLEIVLLSAHIHISSNIDRDEVTCPICQLARGAIKFFHADKAAKLQPLILVTAVCPVARFISSRNIIQPSRIRGPPVA
jgi:hypothetical protein